MKNGLILAAIILVVCAIVAANALCGGHHNPVC